MQCMDQACVTTGVVMFLILPLLQFNKGDKEQTTCNLAGTHRHPLASIKNQTRLMHPPPCSGYSARLHRPHSTAHRPHAGTHGGARRLQTQHHRLRSSPSFVAFTCPSIPSLYLPSLQQGTVYSIVTTLQDIISYYFALPSLSIHLE